MVMDGIQGADERAWMLWEVLPGGLVQYLLTSALLTIWAS